MGGSRPNEIIVRRRDVDAREPATGRLGAAVRIAGPALHRALPIFRVVTDDPQVALTYDDGPHPVHTPAILDALRAHGALATFFVLADRAVAHPGLVKRILDEGHELALHGPDHARLTTMPAVAAARRVLRARRVVESVAGRRITHFRPPYGAQTPALVGMLRVRGLDTVVWSGEGRDWENRTEADIAERVLGPLVPGAVVLLHDDRADAHLSAPDDRPRFDRGLATRQILAGMDDKGLRSVTVRDLRSTSVVVRSYAAEAGRRGEGLPSAPAAS